MARVGRFSYVAILAFVLVGCLWLEVALRTRVLRRWRRLLLSLAPVAVVFMLWDAYAVANGHWHFDQARILGILAATTINHGLAGVLGAWVAARLDRATPAQVCEAYDGAVVEPVLQPEVAFSRG